MQDVFKVLRFEVSEDFELDDNYLKNIESMFLVTMQPIMPIENEEEEEEEENSYD